MSSATNELTSDDLDIVSGGKDFSFSVNCFGTTFTGTQFTGVEGPVTCISMEHGGTYTGGCTNNNP